MQSLGAESARDVCSQLPLPAAWRCTAALQYSQESGFCEHCRSYAVCAYCSCLRMNGEVRETF